MSISLANLRVNYDPILEDIVIVMDFTSNVEGTIFDGAFLSVSNSYSWWRYDVSFCFWCGVSH